MGWFAMVLRRVLNPLGVSLYETTAVVAMTAIVGAVAGAVIMDRIEDAKLKRAADETQTIRDAISKFVAHTGRLPGEAEIRQLGSTWCFLQTGRADEVPLPDVRGLGTPARPLDATAFIGRSCGTFTRDNTLNINDYLARKPSEIYYPNWRGPYMEPIASDPWDRAYVIHVLPQMFMVQAPDPGAGRFLDAAGPLGYGWVLSAGPDRLLQTPLTASEVVPGSDDRGAAMVTKLLRSPGGRSAPALESR